MKQTTITIMRTFTKFMLLFMLAPIFWQCSKETNPIDPVYPAVEVPLLLAKNVGILDYSYKEYQASVTKVSIAILSGNGGYTVTPFRPEDAGVMKFSVKKDSIIIENIDPYTPFTYLVFKVEDKAGKKQD